LFFTHSIFYFNNRRRASLVDVGVVLCDGLCKWLPTSGVVFPPRFGLSFWCTVIYSFEVIRLWCSPRISPV